MRWVWHDDGDAATTRVLLRSYGEFRGRRWPRTVMACAAEPARIRS